MEHKTITVIGTGYVGLTTAVLLAEAGHKVYTVDINPKRLEAIREGRSFFYEAGMDKLVKDVVTAKRLIATDSYKESVSQSSVVFSCVGTPDNPDGSSNLSYVFAAAEESAKYLQKGTVYVQKSTVPVGTGDKTKQIFAKAKCQVEYVSNPEFLREGTAILDSLWFDRVVAGGSNRDACEVIVDLYKGIEQRREEIAARAGLMAPENDHESHYFITNQNSAELIKVTANAFLALKISFANSIAKLADHTDADVNEIMDVVGADRRIGRAFLNAGRGYGGGCFPKDVSGLISSAEEHGVDLEVMVAAAEINASMPGYIVTKAQKELKGLSDKKVAVLGLAFKPGTSDARRSPGIAVANLLAKEGAKVTAFDPEANEEAADDLDDKIVLCEDIKSTVQGADAVFITTAWPELIGCDLSALAQSMKGTLLVDAVDDFAISDVTEAGLQYMGVGR